MKNNLTTALRAVTLSVLVIGAATTAPLLTRTIHEMASLSRRDLFSQ